MAYIARMLGKPIERAARQFPAVIVTGPRRAGKTTLLRKLFPKASYWLLEDPDVVSRIRSDPRGFFEEVRTPAIIDEIQNAPEVLNYIRTRIDAAPGRKGRWFLTGSQEAPLMRGVTESLAGRAAVFQLLPLSTQESDKASLLRGGFPEVLARPAAALVWFRSYLQTYLERDVRDLPTYRRFLSLLATRCGQMLNKTDLAGPLGVSVPTITEWLHILQVTGQVILAPPYFENLGKRIVKSPKLYFVDSGLACHLLGIDTARDLSRSPFAGSLFEGFVASEIVKHQINAGRRAELYYFRDQQGLEVDFVVPQGGRSLVLVEAKAGATAFPRDAEPLAKLAEAASNHQTKSFLVHRPLPGKMALTAVRPGVKAVDLPGLLRELKT